LTEFELRCFSQHGDDGVIAEILSRIGVVTGFFVEFGIESGREGNCVFLADVLGWKGLFIESDETDYAALNRKYIEEERVTSTRAAVTPENVEDLFAAGAVPPEPDVLSIDVDGRDYWIWEAIQAYRPRVVVIEYNATLASHGAVVQPREHDQPWDGTDYFGASLEALCVLGARKGYRLVHTELAALNAFFVRADLAGARFPPAGEVPRREQPNYFMQGYHHPADATHREYVSVTSEPPADPDALRPSAPLAQPVAAPQVPDTSEDQVAALLARTDFVWHQRFELSPGVYTPGANDIEFLLSAAEIPERLDGASVLDIGTTNGGAAFVCERRGATRVVAVDIANDNWFGFAAIKQALRSRAEHVQASVYELPELLPEQFDIVLFWGVLYHLRHPLLALDSVRRLARGTVSIETAVCDHELEEPRGVPLARFYRKDELAGDSSNWFAPTVAALTDWCHSCGLHPSRVHGWPADAPSRAMALASPTLGDPEYAALSYERPLTCSVARLGPQFG
jgi:SAM-dependent methyltransferase